MRRRHEKTYCDACPRPGVLTANRAIWTLFEQSQTQLLFSFGGVAGLNYLAVQWVADKIGITIDEPLFMKLQIIEAEMIMLSNEQPPDAKRGSRNDNDN